VPTGIDQIEQWIGMLRRALETNYARLDKVLAEQATKGKDNRKR
jgi:hypothetical protein